MELHDFNRSNVIEYYPMISLNMGLGFRHHPKCYLSSKTHAGAVEEDKLQGFATLKVSTVVGTF